MRLVKGDIATPVSTLPECFEHDVAFDAMAPSKRCNTVHKLKRAQRNGAFYWSVFRRIHKASMALNPDAFAMRATSTWRTRTSVKGAPNIGICKLRCSDGDISRAAAAVNVEV